MRFTITKTALQTATSVVSKAVVQNATVAFLAGIRIEAKDGWVEMQSTNLAVSIRHSVQATIEEEGVVIVSGKILQSIVKALPDAPVNFDINDGETVLTMSCKRSKFRLNTLEATEFPEFPQVKASTSVTLPSALMSDMTNRVYKVASKDNTRPILQGVNITISNGTVSMVATDSYRLAVCDTKAPDDAGEFNAIVPAATLRDVMGMPTMTDELFIGRSDNQVIMMFGGTTFVTRRIEGNFPNYRQLLPSSCTTSFVTSVNDIAATLRRVSVVASSNPSVRLDIDSEGHLVRLSCSAPDSGESKEEIDCDVTGNSMSISLNHHYLSDCLDGVGEDDLTMELTGPMQPAIVKSYGKVNYLSLLMPVRM